ncbi:M24 family metallopeptidase [Corynebacterium falsenii]|uniref:M24 family metallopeptidase n=1 Tax=Corynebacterium falsenii TaxID=108486 RepID=UPI001D4885A0|nr:aminopeptidase P family protein [Corynebacterium falsenii]MDC7103504.1 aminopeptidase P family protein [Corynebacterium falsenii]HJF11664.1 aminopeptidase P family protein [Corynebacterium falsenii]
MTSQSSASSSTTNSHDPADQGSASTQNRTEVFAARRRRLVEELSKSDHPALLVTDLKNIRYLTGFSGSNATLLVSTSGHHTIATDGRYDTQIRIETGEPDDLTIAVKQQVFEVMTNAAGERGFAVEPSMPVGRANALGNPEVVSGLVEELRLIKDSGEIAALAEAGELADTVWQEFIRDGGIREGITEIEAAADLEYRLRKAGADALSFDTILASGANGSKPHAGVSKDVIVPGLVTVDFGVYLDGYASDQTRTVCVGEPDDLSRSLYDIVYRSQKAGEAAVKPGASLRGVDTACRETIDEAGYGEYFVHSTGHGVGLDVHEAPRAAAGVDPADDAKEGMTLTVEPGIYLPGKTGLRIENTYVVTADGARSLNPSPTELIVV